ncbi:unnamed protein product [Symbiodinium sp. CCMP2592]|nr:unnamed protein product [Symbiodinium sp. CCMP2592]
MARHGLAGSPGMSERIFKFMDADTRNDDESQAFQELRDFIMRKAKSDVGCLSDGVDVKTMVAFLRRLHDFGGRKTTQIRRIGEVLSTLESNAGGPWSAHIKEAREKMFSLPTPVPPGFRALVGASHFQGGCQAKDVTGKCRDAESSESVVKDELTFSQEDTPQHLLHLHEGLQELLSLLLFAEKDDDSRARLNEITAAYNMGWKEILEDKDLHYVFGGLVSTGKTTLVNSFLANVCAEQGPQAEWQGDMLPTAALENTAAVTMFAFRAARSSKISVRLEHVCFIGSPDERTAKFQSASDQLDGVTEIDTMQVLQGRMPELLAQLSRADSGFKRLIVEMPGTMKVLPKPEDFFFTVPAEVVVDTPGLDSPGIQHHLVSVLSQKCFLFCFLVDVTSPSPFGNHGFEVLQFLKQKSEMMFPPVIVFTKWELMKEQATLRSWKRANPKGLEDRVKNLVSALLNKLDEAEIPYTPFFASVNALLAGESVQGSDPDEFYDIRDAQAGLSCFIEDLVKLGRSIANPINQCRMLQLQNQCTQEIINLIHREDGEALLSAESISDMEAFGQALKDRFHKDVEDYFQNICWTSFGLASFTPSAPFNRETCAITQIPNDFEAVFQQYKSHERNQHMLSKFKAVQDIVQHTLLKVQSNIVMNLSKYEAKAIESFKRKLWKHFGMKDKHVKKHLDFAYWQYAVGAGLGGGSILAGIASGNWAIASGISASTYFTGAATCIGMSVAGAGLLVMMTWWGKDQIGGWTWEGAKTASWDAVMEACQKNSGKIGEHVTNTFNRKVDDIIRKMKEHRIVPSSEVPQSKAAVIHNQTRKGYRDVAKRLNDILQSRRDRWLGQPCELKQICQQVLEEREPVEPVEACLRMPMD